MHGPPWLEPRAAYVHIPFCGHHCGYCDFAVAAGQDHLIEHYLDALRLELESLGNPRPVNTVFIGGGTPTYLSGEQLSRMLDLVRDWFPLAADGDLPPEFSIESTPDSLTPQKCLRLAEVGVTRVSVGVQSFQPATLASLDRQHSAEQVPAAVAMVRAAGLAVSLDLIFAAPGSTSTGWMEDLDAAIKLAPEHISTYGLTYEKGTPLWKARDRGQISALSEEDELDRYLGAIDRLTGAGYEHYEVSNFARAGFECRHNLHYWANEAYYGVGVGAARYVDGVREVNVRDTRLYIRRILAGEPATMPSERLSPCDRAFETIGTQIRRMSGIDFARFLEQTGFEFLELVGDRVAALECEGLVTSDGQSVRLTRRGVCLADGIIADLMKANALGFDRQRPI